MKNEIKIFENKEFGAIRTMVMSRATLSSAARMWQRRWGTKKNRNAIAQHVDEDDKTTALIQGVGSNYKTQATFINELGLYSLILGSKLDSARRFKHWVTSEVLPHTTTNLPDRRTPW